MTDFQNPLQDLTKLISVTGPRLHECIDHIDHGSNVGSENCTTRLQYVKFDGNGQPMIPALAEVMYEHAIDYCLAARERPATLSAQEAAKFTKMAKQLFINPAASAEDPDQTGEAGELLLYLMIEAILGAPQVVAKMQLKTNPKLEINGSDGIHMVWDGHDEVVDIYFGEAKIYQDIGAATAAALKSIDSFHENEICKHEFLMVTKQFKHADEKIQKAVFDLFSDGTPKSGIRINHACLIGFNWKDYQQVFLKPTRERVAELRGRYLAAAEGLHAQLKTKLGAFKSKHLRLTVFFLPFVSVQEFRDAFNKALK